MKIRKSKNEDDSWKEKTPLIYQVKNSTTGLCCPLSDS